MKALIKAIRELTAARPLNGAELDALRARGNRGDLQDIRLGPTCRAEALQSIWGSSFQGSCLLLGPAPLDIEGCSIRNAIVGSATLRSSSISNSLIGDGVSISHQSVVDGSVLLPFRQRIEGTVHTFQLYVTSSHVSHCVVFGGTHVGPYAHIRSHSLIGPFAHIGTGSEVKASCVIGATPRNRIEIPHRSYFGNAAAKALKINAHFGSDDYNRELEEKLSALLFGEIDSVIADEDIPGSVQPLERLKTRRDGGQMILEVEGVNLGALTTTSNFDPRNGGVKMPTNVEAGARFGVLSTMAAPVQVAPGVLVASGAKIGGMDVPEASLVLGGGGEAQVLEGYLQKNRGRLGDGTESAVKLVRAYLAQLRSFQNVLAAQAEHARGMERVAVAKAHAAIGFQLAEIASWLHRYLDLVRVSVQRLTRDLETEKSEARGERLEARLREQRRVLSQAQDHIQQLGELRSVVQQEGNRLTEQVSLSRVTEEHTAHWARLAVRRPDQLRLLPSATDIELETTVEKLQAESADLEKPPLFGTSGIRGVFQREHDLAPVAALEREAVVTPALAYFLGRALGRFLVRRGDPKVASIGSDGRPSGAALGSALRDGLLDEGINVEEVGIQTTVAAAALPNRLVLVITASHNAPHHNGIKAFVGSAPLSRPIEEELEQDIRLLERLALSARTVSPLRSSVDRGRVMSGATRAYQAHLSRLQAEVLELGIKGRLHGRRLPLDLAHGAAAADVAGDEIIPSPPMAAFLETGTVLVTYGGERDGTKVNVRSGAAFIYGEGRAHKGGEEHDTRPAPHELRALAEGAHGYGAGIFDDGTSAGPPASRSVYWPSSVALEAELASIAHGVAGGHWAFLDIDRPSRSVLRQRLEAALKRLPLLPALSVDGDADRTVVVDRAIAEGDPGFLTGDALLMLFATHSRNGVSRVVFTVESDLTLERFLQGNDVPYEIVTVGDRAVTECILARANLGATKELLGGEPSGHLIFARRSEDSIDIVDDPFAVLLRLVEIESRLSRSLGELYAELVTGTAEGITQRKPDAWGTGGLSRREKAGLRLRANRSSPALSDYAKRFIPAYQRRFALAYGRVFVDAEAQVDSMLAADFEELLSGAISPGPGKREVRVGEIRVSKGGEIQDKLSTTVQIAGVDYFGPDDIILRFYGTDQDENPIKVGEVVTRNSGTSAKNAAYHKLWPLHPRSQRRADPEAARAAIAELARWRAEFTNEYVEERFPSSDSAPLD